jgi:hypothetical protein
LIRLIIPKFAIPNPQFPPTPCTLRHALMLLYSARPAILPSNSRMIPDEIRQWFAVITLIPNPFAFIFGIMPLLAFYAIARVLCSEPRPGAYADWGTELRRLAMQQLRADPQRFFRSRNREASQTELSDQKSSDNRSGRVRRIFTQRDGALMLDRSPKIGSAYSR